MDVRRVRPAVTCDATFESDVDPVTLAVGVGSQLLLQLHRRLGVLMSLAHCYLLVTRRFPAGRIGQLYPNPSAHDARAGDHAIDSRPRVGAGSPATLPR